jgi:phosphate-selective porin OprO/OprP
LARITRQSPCGPKWRFSERKGTRERRRWNAANGGFTGVRPEGPFNLEAGGWGVWEIAARYGFLDLNENEGEIGTAPLQCAKGGVSR